MVGAVNLSFTVIGLIFTVDKFGRRSVDDYRGARHGGIYVDLGNYFLYPFGGYGIIGLHAGLYGGIRYVVGTGLLGVTGRDLPELDPLHSNEYRRGGAVDRQLLGIMDFPDAG